MYKVKTSRFGEIEVEDTQAIELPHGMVGFPELKKYILLDHDKESPFKWLQSLEDGDIAFVLLNPLLFKPDYSVEVSESEVSDLGLKTEEDAVISVVITMPSQPQQMTANLKAPLIFNIQNRKGKQIILNHSQYTTRHNVLEEMKLSTVNAQKTQTAQQSLQQEEAKAREFIESLDDQLKAK